MFRAVPMMQLRAVILERDERAALEGLGRLGVVQLSRTQSETDMGPLAPCDRKGELNRCDRIGMRVDELRRSLDIQPPLMEPRRVEMTLDRVEERLSAMEERTAEPIARRRLLVQRQKGLEETCERASSYLGFDIPADRQGFSFLHFVVGSIPAGNLERVEAEIGEKAILLPLIRQEGRQTVAAVTTRSSRSVLEGALERAGFQREVFLPSSGMTVDTLWGKTETELAQVSAELEGVNGELRVLSAEFAQPLGEIQGLVMMERRLLEAGQKLSRTEASVYLTGWAPADTVPTIEKRMDQITRGCYALRAVCPDKSVTDEVPVLLHHSRLLRPFEVLVSTYGLPAYRELEPTFFVGLSYLIMFGLMFGDAGHGFVLALCGLLLLTLPAFSKARDFGFLLLFGGLSSVFFGVVYGSYFGIGSLKRYALWHDPLEGDPIRLMYVTIGFGIAMISLGLILNIVNRFQRGDVIGAFLDKFGFAGLLFYWGTLVILTNSGFFTSRGLTGLSIILFLGLPMLGWAVKEPAEHLLARKGKRHGEAEGGMGDAITESLVGTFEGVLSYLANTISFVRLAAYAMSHAALLVAAFMLAAQVRGISVGGGLWSIVVIILGNAVAIVLEGIIASVQALRLEYYEFFGKFFSGNGQPFEPFRLPERERT